MLYACIMDAVEPVADVLKHSRALLHMYIRLGNDVWDNYKDAFQIHMWGDTGKGTYRGLTTKMRFMYKILTICPMFIVIQTKLEKPLFMSSYDPKH